jgi:hypothetical protein
MYLPKDQLEPVLSEIPFIEATPKILLFHADRDSVILE